MAFSKGIIIGPRWSGEISRAKGNLIVVVPTLTRGMTLGVVNWVGTPALHSVLDALD